MIEYGTVAEPLPRSVPLVAGTRTKGVVAGAGVGGAIAEATCRRLTAGIADPLSTAEELVMPLAATVTTVGAAAKPWPKSKTKPRAKLLAKEISTKNPQEKQPRTLSKKSV